MGLRQCTGCHEWKEPIEFPFRGRKSGQRITRCRTCRTQIVKKSKTSGRGRERQKFGFIRRKYGLSRDEYNRMLEEQNGHCKICGNGFTGRICVDHDHKTGKVRGLLCTPCNVGLGRVERLGWLKKAIQYLRH